ncbi:UDP-glycosyltransferase UGT4-like isoform X1 [Metopolophium dirhodum]|uniref:UDP-glycosyltransferase UGT4-like isoform X1 n=1 Tax=Metopolophium dirhodum TaxID=44670 RepID=UPI00298F680D|nr:UDP-glycosyltransferase UGT4-like isoform X1 [Metopolophium dirhodum]XP_060876407.1 UDP-glycosyltransferase UGT4-like isoform X1 [Metopolophium dirhodum]
MFTYKMLPSMFFCTIACAAITIARASNILVFMPMPFKSHVRGYQPLFEELSRRGHNVTVVSSYPQNRQITNYTDIGPFISKDHERNVMEMMNMNFVTSALSVWDIGVKFSEVLTHKSMVDFLQTNSVSFDLVMIETCCQEYTVALGHKFNAPVINLVPAMLWSTNSKWIHVPSTFSYIPNILLGITSDMSFTQRLKNTITGVLQLYVENYLYLPKMKEVMDTHFIYKGWESRPSLEDMLNNVSLTLVNSHHAVGVSRPYLPGVIDVGGMHIKESKSLSGDLQTFVESAEHGVIYFSFGSVINLNHLPKEKLNIFLGTIEKLKQKVILKWIPDGSIKLSQNVLTGSWFPQSDILAHPNVRLFITHGGLHSLEETVYYAKPVVAIPFFGDQHINMKLVEIKGYGKLVDYFEITEESFGNAIKEVLSDPTFKKNIEIQSRIYRDQPMKPLQRAVYWVEYIIRNGGAGHLKGDSVGLNDMQYFLFDIVFILLIPIVCIVWLCYLFVVRIANLFNM